MDKPKGPCLCTTENPVVLPGGEPLKRVEFQISVPARIELRGIAFGIFPVDISLSDVGKIFNVKVFNAPPELAVWDDTQGWVVKVATAEWLTYVERFHKKNERRASRLILSSDSRLVLKVALAQVPMLVPGLTCANNYRFHEPARAEPCVLKGLLEWGEPVTLSQGASLRFLLMGWQREGLVDENA